MRDAVVNGLVAGGLALLGVFLGARLSQRQQRRADEKAAHDRLRAQAEAMIHAVIDMRTSTAAHDATWTSRRTRLQLLGIALLEIIPVLGRRESVDFGRAMTRTAGVAWDWNLRSMASLPKLSEAYSRMAAAAFQLSLSPDLRVAEATRRLSDAVVENAESPKIDEAMAGFRAAIIAATSPQAGRSWRLGRRFARRESANGKSTGGVNVSTGRRQQATVGRKKAPTDDSL